MRAGRHVGWFLVAAAFLYLVLVIPNPCHPPRRPTYCLSNEKQIMLGMLIYTRDNDNRFPPSAHWQTCSQPYISNTQVFKCSSAQVQPLPHYAMLSKWGGADHRQLDGGHTVVLYEVADGQPVLRHPWGECEQYDNLYQRLNSALRPIGMNLGYADGHCRWRSQIPSSVFSDGFEAQAARRLAPDSRSDFNRQVRRLFLGRGERK